MASDSISPMRCVRAWMLAAAVASVLAHHAAAQANATALVTARAPSEFFDLFPSPRPLPAGPTLDISFASGALELSEPVIADWITASARTIAAFYGRFPVDRLEVRVLSAEGSGVRSGSANADAGAALKITLGRAVTRGQLSQDWILLHELAHLAFPEVDRQHHWIEEGLATYVEAIASTKAGRRTEADLWRWFDWGMPKGLPQSGDRGLDHTPTWGRTYWGGAMFCLLADVEIRERTQGRRGLQDALRAIVAAGGNMEVHWPLDRALSIGDAAVGVPVLTELYGKMKATPVDVDLASLWQRLGVAVNGDQVVFNDDAPLAAIRRAITARESES